MDGLDHDGKAVGTVECYLTFQPFQISFVSSLGFFDLPSRPLGLLSYE